MSDLVRVPPEESKSFAYLKERGIDPKNAIFHGARWTVNPMTMAERLGLDADGNFSRQVQDDNFFEQFPKWSKDTGMLERNYDRLKRNWKPLGWEPGMDELLSFPAHGGAGWINKVFSNRKDATIPLFIAEGAAKCLALQQAGVMAIGLNGTWMSEAVPDKEDLGLKAYQRQKQLPKALREFNWFGRTVYFAFDADQLINAGVRHSLVRSFILLHTVGAKVMQLTTWDLGQSKGIDDLLVSRGGQEKAAETLKELIGKARPFIETLDKQRDGVFVTREMRNVAMAPVQFETLSGDIAKAAGIGKRAFGKYPASDKFKENKSGVEPVKIPPTAEPWDEPVEPAEVLDAICEAEKRFVWMKPSQRRAVALWVVLTYLHDVVDILPMLLITSPEEECGKSTLLKLVLYLSNRPVRAGNISAAAIYRTIKDICSTMCLDEAETYLKDNEEMRGVIDSGHEREFAWVIRTAMEGEDTVQFSTWCPKALAQIGLPKRTILSRSIHIRLGRKPKDTKTEKLRKKHYQEFEDLRRKISRLADDIRDHVKVFEDETLENRAGDNWQPLFAIADAASKEWLKEAILAAQRIYRKDKQEMKSFGRYLLESLDRIIAAKREKLKLGPDEKIFLRTLELVSELNKDGEGPWKDDKSGELSTRRLAKELGGYEIRSKRVQEGPDRGMGYWSDDIERESQKYARE